MIKKTYGHNSVACMFFEGVRILLNISEYLKATWISLIYLERGRADEKNAVLHNAHTIILKSYLDIAS